MLFSSPLRPPSQVRALATESQSFPRGLLWTCPASSSPRGSICDNFPALIFSKGIEPPQPTIPCSPWRRAVAQCRLAAISLVCTSFPAVLDLLETPARPGSPALAAPLESAAHKGDRSGRRMGASPATKAMEPAQDRSCRTPTTGALRKFLRSDKSFSYFLRQNRDLYTSGPLTSSSPASRLAPIHFTLLPASAFSSLTGKPKILKSRRVKVNRCMAWFLLGRMKMGSST